VRSWVLVDTGPLVALIREADEWHNACAVQFQHLSPPLFTCMPVVTEAAYILRDSTLGVRKLFDFFRVDVLRLLHFDREAFAWIAEFLERYENKKGKKPQFADAALVYLAERENIETIFTTDHTDFSIYRFSGKRSFEILPPVRT
jgi:predicted nucleic acid-binding protein